MIYKISEKGSFRNITAKLKPELKEFIAPGLKLQAPISVGGNYQKIELTYMIENDSPIVRFRLNKEVDQTSAIEILIRIAEDLLTNIKMR